MQTSLKAYMKVGIVLQMAYSNVITDENSIISCLSKIATDDYFEAVEITKINDDKVRKQITEIANISRLDIVYGGQSLLLSNRLNINHLDDCERQKAINILKKGIDEAYKVNAKNFSFLAGHYNKDTINEAFKALIQSTEELCKYSKTKGNMPILCEIFDYDIDKKSLIGPIDLVKEYGKLMVEKYDNFGLMVDSSHIPLLHETFKESILPIKKYIKHAHIGNTVLKSGCLGYGDSHPRFGFPNGENDVNELAEYLQILLDIGFLNKEKRPIVSFEVKPFENEKSELVIANAKRTLNAAWLLVNKNK